MTGLALAGAMTPGWVFALATLTGLVRPNDLIMRNSLIGQTIRPRRSDGRARHVARDHGLREGGRRAGRRRALHRARCPRHLRLRGDLLCGQPRADLRHRAAAIGARSIRVAAPRRRRAVGLARSQGRARARVDDARGAGDDAAGVSHQPDRLSGLRRPAALRRAAHLSRRCHRARIPRGQLLLRRPARLARHGVHGRTAPPRARHAGVHRDLVRDGLRLRPRDEHRRGQPHPHGRGLRAERGDDRHDGHAAGRRRRGIPRPGDGRADAGGLRPAAGPHGLRLPHRADRLPADDQPLGHPRPALHLPHRPALARQHLDAPRPAGQPSGCEGPGALPGWTGVLLSGGGSCST